MVDTDIDLKAIKAALAEMEKHPFPVSKRPLTARLVDENDPDGDVILVDDAGMIRYSMPRSVYEDLRSMKPVPADPVVEEPEKENWLSLLEKAPLREEVLYMTEKDFNDLRAWLLEDRLTDVSMGCKVAEDPKTKFDQLYQGIVPEGVPEFRPGLRYIGTPSYIGGIPPRVDILCEDPQWAREWGLTFKDCAVNHVRPSFVKLKPDETEKDD